MFFRACLLALLLSSLVGVAGAAPDEVHPQLPAAADGSSTYLVSLARTTVAEVAELGEIVDVYDAFVVVELDSRAARGLSEKGARLRILERDLLRVHDHVLDTRLGADALSRGIPEPFRAEPGADGLYIVQFRGPIRPSWRHEVERQGARFVPSAFFPPFAQLAWIAGDALADIGSNPAVRWVGAYHPWYRTQAVSAKDGSARGLSKGTRMPRLLIESTERGPRRWRVRLVPQGVGRSSAEPAADLRTQAENLGLKVSDQHPGLHYLAGPVMVVEGPAEQVAEILRWPDVLAITPVGFFQPTLDTARELHQVGIGDGCDGALSEVPVWAAGITGAGPAPGVGATAGTEQLLGVIDSTYDSPDLDCGDGVPNASIYEYVSYNQAEGCDIDNVVASCIGGNSHGTAVAGIMLGSGSMDGPENPIQACTRKGHAFGARLWGLRCAGSTDDLSCLNQCSPEQTLADFFAASHADGSRLSNHSYGDGTLPYDALTELVDALAYDNDNDPSNGPNQTYLWFFAAGNDGSSSGTVGNPGLSKNDITGAAVYNGISGSCSGDSGPCDESKIVSYSSRGPTAAGQHGPDLAGASQWQSAPDDGSGYQSFNGTSAGTPNLVGLAALVRDWLVDRHGIADPSAPLMKALLLGSGDYVDSPAENLPGTAQGWGRPNLSRLCDDWGVAGCQATRSLWREGTATASGQVSGSLSVVVNDPNQDLRCMLVWMDPPNLAGGGALVNDLDLRMTAPDDTCYRGNAFSGAHSVAGCAGSDTVNVDEGVRVASPQAGVWQVDVVGTHIASGPQPWAVVCSGGLAEPGPSVAATGYTVIDSCPGGVGDGNGIIEPGESVVLQLTAANAGSEDLSGIVGSFAIAGPGVTVVDGAADWPALPVGSSSVSNGDHLAFEVSSGYGCGEAILGTVDFAYDQGANRDALSIPVGTTRTLALLAEDFASGIPGDWTVIDGGSGGNPSTWVAGSVDSPENHGNAGSWPPTAPFSAPWAIMDSDAASIGASQDEQLISPTFDTAGCTSVRLVFANQLRTYTDPIADVDVSTDGLTWHNALRMTTDDGYPTAGIESVDLTPWTSTAPGPTQVRFHYSDASWDYWWAVDDVEVLCDVPACDVCGGTPPPGADFAVDCSPTSISGAPGAQTGATTCTVTSTGGFASAVSFSCSGLPGASSCDFQPSSVVPPADGSAGSSLVVLIDGQAAAGSYGVTVTGADDETNRSASVDLVVDGGPPPPMPDFAIACAPSNLDGEAGGDSTASVCTVSSIDGFSIETSLACSGLPGASTCRFTPSSVVPPADGSAGSTLVIGIGPAVADGSYPVTVTGTVATFDGTGETRNTTVTLVVSSNPPPPDGGLLIDESFDGGTPVDWTIVDGGYGGPPDTWTVGTSRNIGAPFSGQWAIMDSDAAGLGASQDEELRSPVVDASGCSTLTLRFSNQYHDYVFEKADVDVSTDGGSTWIRLLRMSGSNDGYPTPNTKTLDLSAHASPTLQVRFHYHDASWDNWWAVDNVELQCD